MKTQTNTRAGGLASLPMGFTPPPPPPPPTDTTIGG